MKQADAILLGFPLQHEMSPDVRKNDLEIYEKVCIIKSAKFINIKAKAMIL